MRAEAVDRPLVTAVPEQPSEPQRGAHEQEIVQLVEIPFVRDEFVDCWELLDEARRRARLLDVVPPRDPQSDQHDDRRRQLNPGRSLLPRHREATAECNRPAPEGRRAIRIDENLMEELT